MAYTTIKKPSDYFNTKLYVGDGTSSQAITGLNFSPDLVWIKDRDYAIGHFLFDTIRGAGKDLVSNATNAEGTNSADGYLSSFDSDGFTLNNGTWRRTGYSGDNYVGWSWRGSDSSAVSNTDGSITSTVSANTTSGFSIVSYTGTSSAETVGHGLGVAPNMIIVKPYSVSQYWSVFHSSIGNTYYGYLNTTDAFINSPSTVWNSTINSTVFGIGSGVATNVNSASHIAYCFAEKKGFSKFGSYTGNGNADGTFVYTGFKPAFIMIKSSSVSSDWNIWDNKRPDYNVVNRSLEPHQSDAETVSAGRDIDILSNGFKSRGTSSSMNGSGASYIYMAFAEEPLVGDNPCTAR